MRIRNIVCKATRQEVRNSLLAGSPNPSTEKYIRKVLLIDLTIITLKTKQFSCLVIMQYLEGSTPRVLAANK